MKFELVSEIPIGRYGKYEDLKAAVISTVGTGGAVKIEMDGLENLLVRCPSAVLKLRKKGYKVRKRQVLGSLYLWAELLEPKE